MGQVSDIRILPGEIKGKVQGSRSSPYSVSINVKTLTENDIHRLHDYLQRNFELMIKLLDGEFPNDLEQIFERIGIFPDEEHLVEISCSCPDWGDPCKHGVAMISVFSEILDTQPAQLLKFRGYEPEQFHQYLKELLKDTRPITQQEDYVISSFHTEFESLINKTKKKSNPQMATLSKLIDQNLNELSIQPIFGDSKNYWLTSSYRAAISFVEDINEMIEQRSDNQVKLNMDPEILRDPSKVLPGQMKRELMQIYGVGESLSSELVKRGIGCIQMIAKLENLPELYQDLLKINGMGSIKLGKLITEAQSLVSEGFRCYHQPEKLGEKNRIEESTIAEAEKDQRVSSRAINTDNKLSRKLVSPNQDLSKSQRKVLQKELAQLTGVGKSTADILLEIGITSLEDLAIHPEQYYDNGLLPNITIDQFHKQASLLTTSSSGSVARQFGTPQKSFQIKRAKSGPKVEKIKEINKSGHIQETQSSEKSELSTSPLTSSGMKLQKDNTSSSSHTVKRKKPSHPSPSIKERSTSISVQDQIRLEHIQSFEMSFYGLECPIDLSIPFSRLGSRFTGSLEQILRGYIHLLPSELLEELSSKSYRKTLWKTFEFLDPNDIEGLLEEEIYTLAKFLKIERWTYNDLYTKLEDKWDRLKKEGDQLFKDFVEYYLSSVIQSSISRNGPLSLQNLSGIGKQREEKLRQLGIHTMVDFLEVSLTSISTRISVSAGFIHDKIERSRRRIVAIVSEGDL